MVWSGDFKSAMKAYEKGDYTYAVKELKLLAKTGHSMAQHFLGEMLSYPHLQHPAPLQVTIL